MNASSLYIALVCLTLASLFLKVGNACARHYPSGAPPLWVCAGAIYLCAIAWLLDYYLDLGLRW
ncbi:hypothetical protein [Achromobacter spanius]|uniref:hypothetical protein n=1 Tax=Achromobacter spanius TaxID=217203 RepID=UPI003808C827